MSTPTGKLKPGDKIRHKKSGQIWEVIERVGNDVNYAVKVKPIRGTGAVLNPKSRRRGYELITSAAYWLKNGWDIVNDPRNPFILPPKEVARANGH